VSAGIVTPEAVILEFETAGVGSRLIATVVDLAIRGALFGVLVVGTTVIGTAVPQIGVAGLFVALFLVVFGYPIAFETLWRGRTPGKAAMGLRVVTVEGSPVGFRHVAVRALLGLVDFVLTGGGAAVLSVLITRRNQRLGDLVAGTLVIRERTGAAQPTAVTFWVPTGYESYTASLDVSGLTTLDYSAVRSFLLRAGSLDPGVRQHLAVQIATPLLGRLRHTPPPWVGPEALLACVAAAYQHRARYSTGTASGAPVPAWRPSEAPPGPSVSPAPLDTPPVIGPPDDRGGGYVPPS
jgi:uncharacterized RDD family membrane protein YckC